MVKVNSTWDFPGGPVVKTSPSKAEDVSLIPGQGAKIPDGKPKKKKKKHQTENTNSIVTNTIKTLKMDHTKRILKIQSRKMKTIAHT